MISSMTGFGQATAEVEGVLYSVEIRSLNNRYFKAHLRLPDLAAFLEDDLEKLHRNLLYRGSVNFTLRMKNVSGQALVDIDERALQAYMDRLTALIREDAPCRVDLASMLSLPGIVQPLTPDAKTQEIMQKTIMELTHEAIEQLKQSRREEGKLLTEDLKSNCQAIREKLTVVRGRQDAVVQEYHQKLKKRAEDLLAQAQLNMDEALLAREVAIFAERSDISEEVIRLETHLGQFEACMQNSGPAGRRLDFIAQEMLREANTIASKAADATVGQCVIDIKCAVDRIKEQVQNIE